MARDAASVARASGQEDGLNLGLEHLEVQLLQSGGGRSWLLAEQPERHQDPRSNCQIHRSPPQCLESVFSAEAVCPFLLVPGMAPFSTRNVTTVSYLRAFAASSAVRPSVLAALISTPSSVSSFTASSVSASRSPRPS